MKMEENYILSDNSKSVVVCMLSYNHGKFIEKAINSVLEQEVSFKIHLIISDDGSKDNSSDILSKYKINPNISVFIQARNLGLTENAKFLYSKAIELKPDYIATLEGDDYWIDSKKLNKQFMFMENDANKDVVLTCGNFRELDEESGIETSSNIAFNNHKGHWNLLEPSSILLNWRTKYLTYFFRTSQFIKANIFRYSYLVDYTIIYELVKLGNIYFLDEELGVYRRHEGGNFGKANVNQRYQIEKKIYRSILKFNSNDTYFWGKYRKIAKKQSIKDYFKYLIEYKFKKIVFEI